MTAVERVARAMYERQPLPHPRAGHTDGGPMTWEEADAEAEAYTLILRDQARAAIEALREPDEAMQLAGALRANGFDGPERVAGQRASLIFCAMIAAALGEEG